MAVEGEAAEGSSFIIKSQKLDEKSEALSPEDIAWVDSCLIKESDISDGNWNSVTDALLEILSSQPGLYNSSASVNDESHQEKDVEMLTTSESAEADQFLEMESETEEFPRTPNNLPSINEEAESSSDFSPIKDISDIHSLPFAGNPFLPSYTEDLNETQTIESETDLSSSMDEIKPLTEDIFRVWDLNFPAEENELDKQLNKILEESDSQLKPSAFDDSGLRKDLKEESLGKDLKVESLDDVIAAISNISLN